MLLMDMLLMDMVVIRIVRKVDCTGRRKKEAIYVSYRRGLMTEFIGKMMFEKIGYHIVASTAPPK